VGVLTINPQLGVDCLRVSFGNSMNSPESDPERFLSMIMLKTQSLISLDGHNMVDDLPGFQLDSR
jgi:hypothetical protein